MTESARASGHTAIVEDFGTATGTLTAPSPGYAAKTVATVVMGPDVILVRTAIQKPPFPRLFLKRILQVEFEHNDPGNPLNFPTWRKWTIALIACYITSLAGSSPSGYTSGYTTMVPELHTTTYLANVALALYPIGFGITPLFTAPFSEEFGRRPVYLISGVACALSHVMMALAPNIATIMAGQFLAGCFGSTGSAMVGGSLADIFVPRQHDSRGFPMALLTFAALGGTGFGPVGAGWIEVDPRFGWRWIRWFQAIAIGVMVFLLILMPETRSSVILTHRAKKMRKETGDERYRSKAELEQPPILELIRISCIRPLSLSFADNLDIWLGFGWGIFYCLIDALAPAFRSVHQFGTGEVGTIFLTMPIGCLCGLITNFHQEYLYAKKFKKWGPEARLYWSMGAGIMVPAAMFIFAWTTLPQVPWAAMAVGPTIFMWALFMFYLAAFSYIADCYGPYASSAIAAQSMCRNIVGSLFPFFIAQFFSALTYKWGLTLFACIAVLIMPIPFVLFRYGYVIRRRSKFSRIAMELQEEQEREQ
ncbi:drug transporter [Vararia minispora EC-137]|uniref:Drug transporter n=1 Tax=Vararia minispora EC-137 TaxID=1314806 RepID=A0ACB8Q5V5_9AGAM|nr:drug transporter [Vararia minispora EC-137]